MSCWRGFVPFEGETTFGILQQQLNVQPRPPIEVNPALPPGLNQIILTALAKDPAQRFQTAEEFRAALKPFAFGPKGEVAGDAAPAAQPSFAPVPVAGAQLPASPGPIPMAAAVPFNPSQPPQARPGGNKPLWIATGAVAVLLALVGLGFALPHFLHTSAASSRDAKSSTPYTIDTSNPVVSAPDTTVRDSVPVMRGAPGNEANGPGPLAAEIPTPGRRLVKSQGERSSGEGKSVRNEDQSGSAAQGGVVVKAPSPAPADDGAELEQMQNQLVQLDARASAARRSVAQIRAQQAQDGFGMRADVESADAQLEAYVRQAGEDVRSGNVARATRDMDKADAELAILEKFLGH